MVALLIQDVTLVKTERIAIHVRFRGGRTTSLEIDKLKPIALIRKTLPEVVAKVNELLETCTDRQVAEHLNALGYTNWKGESFTHKKVIIIRNAYRLKSRFERLRERGMLTANELAAQLGVCPTSIYLWGQRGLFASTSLRQSAPLPVRAHRRCRPCASRQSLSGRLPVGRARTLVRII
jgi:hypothetical protein